MSKNYFNQLNYVLGNEDNSVEFNILSEGTNHVLAAAGSGTRVIPLLAKSPRLLTCVDVSREQLFLTELRIESLRSLDYSRYLGFWGYPPEQLSTTERERIFSQFTLSKDAATYLENLFKVIKWNAILYEGKWERTFVSISRLLRLFIGGAGTRLLDFAETSDYFNYLENRFPRRAWNCALFLLGNSAVFNALLYRGSFPKKNIGKSHYRFYQNAFDSLFKQGLARNNSFLQLLFLGKIAFHEGLPFDCNEEIYQRAKLRLQSIEIRYVWGDIIETIQKTDTPIDFISFSDIPSYFEGPREKSFLEDIKNNLSPGALVVIRYYLKITDTDLSSFSNITSNHTSLMEKEKMQMYTIQVL